MSSSLITVVTDILALNSGLTAAEARDLSIKVLTTLEANRLLVLCEDCIGAGDDLCDVCDGSGQRSGGRCNSCYPTGSGTLECPTCDGHGYVTRDNAESMGWVE